MRAIVDPTGAAGARDSGRQTEPLGKDVAPRGAFDGKTRVRLNADPFGMTVTRFRAQGCGLRTGTLRRGKRCPTETISNELWR